LSLVSDVFPTLMLYFWRTFRLLSTVLSGWISILTVKAYGCHLFRKVYCSCATCGSCICVVFVTLCIRRDSCLLLYVRLVAFYFLHALSQDPTQAHTERTHTALQSKSKVHSRTSQIQIQCNMGIETKQPNTHHK